MPNMAFLRRVLLLASAAKVVLTTALAAGDDAGEVLLQDAIKESCEGELDDATQLLSSVDRESTAYVPALHTLGAIAAVKGDLTTSGAYHGVARALDPTVVPPLATIHLEGKPCNNIGDIFFSASFVKKQVYDSFQNQGDANFYYALLESNATLRHHEDAANVRYDAHIGLGTQLHDSGFVAEANKHFRLAQELRPEDIGLQLRNALTVPVVYESMQHVEEARRQLEDSVSRILALARTREEIGDIALDHVSMPGTYYIVYGGHNDAVLMGKIAQIYGTLFPDLQQVMLPGTFGGENDKVDTKHANRKGTIRVGFVSHYFRRHSVCKLLCGIIHGLGEQFHVTIFSSTNNEDDWTNYVSERADEFVRLPEGFTTRNRDVVREHDIDILVFSDIGMNTGATIWAHGRLAPLQLCFWGHPHTTGLPYMDYFVSSDLFELSSGGDAQDRHTEQLVRMSSLSFFFHNPGTGRHLLSDERRGVANPMQDGIFDMASIGVPEGSLVLLVPQTLPKFHPSFDRVIRTLLRQQNLYIVIIFDQDKPIWKQRLLQRLGAASEDCHRLVFLPTQSSSDFVRIVRASTFLLDPYPFGGGVTTLEAFGECKAVVTLPAEQSVIQLTAGMAKRMGLDGVLVADSVDDYLEKAKLLMYPEFRQEVEREICSRNHVLYEQEDAIKEWEVVLSAIYANF